MFIYLWSQQPLVQIWHVFSFEWELIELYCALYSIWLSGYTSSVRLQIIEFWGCISQLEFCQIWLHLLQPLTNIDFIFFLVGWLYLRLNTWHLTAWSAAKKLLAVLYVTKKRVRLPLGRTKLTISCQKYQDNMGLYPRPSYSAYEPYNMKIFIQF